MTSGTDRNFIGISGVIKNDKLVYINTSNDNRLHNEQGLTALQVIEFIHSLKPIDKKDKSVFVCYNFTKTAEFIFAGLSNELKDELFQNYQTRKEVDELTKLKTDVEAIFYDKEIEMSEEQAVECYNYLTEINLSLSQTGKVKFHGYTLTLQGGRGLTISKGKTTIVLYDIYGFLRQPLAKVVKIFCGVDMLYDEQQEDINRSVLTAAYIAFFAAKLDSELKKNGIELSRFNGASNITSYVLSKANARDEYRSYKTPKVLSKELQFAVNQSFYGGRIEQMKVGYFENINVYDMNSAYAKACLFLPKMLQRPIMLKSYRDEPFSMWHIEYDLPDGVFYGCVPDRDSRQTTRYQKQGRGYYWKPEVDYLLKHYPNNIKINGGCYVPFVPTDFSRAILDLYYLRLQLQKQGNPLEKVLKLALAIIYGKFCQRVGRAYYYNMFYAGYVTSFVRAELLKATRGYEDKTICFLTDAIHTTAKLDVSLTDAVGDYRLESFDDGVYLGAAIYKLRGKEKTKQATRGFTELDFENAFFELQLNGYYKVLQELFVGYNLHSFMPTKFAGYLSNQHLDYKINPLESRVRVFDKLNINLQNHNSTSKMFTDNNTHESSVYNPNVYYEHEFIANGMIATE